MRFILWPFKTIWALIGFLFALLGRILTAVIGLCVVAVGVVLSITVIGLIAGIPLILFGVLLIIRAIF